MNIAKQNYLTFNGNDTVGMKTGNRMFWLDCGVDVKNSMRKISLTSTSTIHMVIPISLLS